MKINKKQLQEGLAIVKPGLASKDMIEQATSFAFINGCVCTYNDEISISHPIEGLELQGAIKANELYQLLSKMRNDTINVKNEESKIILKAGNARAGFILEQDIKLPLSEINKTTKWKKIPEGFLEAVKQVYPAAKADISSPIVNCVHINKDGFIEATDNYRASRVTLAKKFPFKTVLVPAGSIAKALPLKPTHIGNADGWVHFKNDAGTIFSARILDDTYPNLTPILELKNPTSLKLPSEPLLEAISKAEPFYKRSAVMDEFMEVVTTKGNIRVRAESESGSFYEEDIECSMKKQLSFAIIPHLMVGALEKGASISINDKMIKFVLENWQFICVLHYNNA